MNIWDDVILFHGKKRYPCVCIVCGDYFLGSSPYTEKCRDKAKHDLLRAEQEVQDGWKDIPNRPTFNEEEEI